MTTGNPCILIIEDDFAARKALVDLLQDEGYSVAYAVNGRRTRPWPTFLLQS